MNKLVGAVAFPVTWAGGPAYPLRNLGGCPVQRSAWAGFCSSTGMSILRVQFLQPVLPTNLDLALLLSRLCEIIGKLHP